MRELGRRERLPPREMNAAPVAFDEIFFPENVRCFVQQQVRVLCALHIDVGMERFDRRGRRRLFDNRDVIHDFERRELPRTILLGEGDGPFLRDVPVADDGHHQHVAKRARILEVNEVSHVDEVEGPVTEHDGLLA